MTNGLHGEARRERRRPARAPAWALALVLAGSTCASAATYHVAASGSDAGPGTPAQPWATLQHAVDNVRPGDVILVEPGRYAGCRIESSGAVGTPCTLAAQTPGTVVVDAPGPRNRHQSHVEVELFGTTLTDWIIDGLEVDGAARYGIDLRDCDRMTVRRCNVHGSAVTGIFDGFVDHALYEDNESWQNGEHGVYHSNSGDFAVIRRNRLHDNAAAGVHSNGDASQGGDGIISNCLYERNVIWNNGMLGGSGINCDGVTDSIIRNNLIFGNHASGIALYGIDGAVASSRNLVANNTIVMPDDGRSRWVINMSAFGPTQPVGNGIINNILFTPRLNRGSVDVWDPAAPGFSSDHNVVVDRFSPDSEASIITLAEWRAFGHDLNSFIATPDELFVDWTNGDYRLRPGSPAIDAGLQLPEVTEDLEGLTRFSGATHDIGAHELQSCALPAVQLVSNLRVGADRQTVAWDALAGADTYDVVRGDLLTLHATRGDFGAALETCVEDDGGDEVAVDATGPSPLGALFYLVRARACDTALTYDGGDALQLAPRDGPIAGSPAACP